MKYFIVIVAIFLGNCLNFLSAMDDALQSNLKRKLETVENSASADKRGKIALSNKQGTNVKYHFGCSRCNCQPKTRPAISRHMHNTCFPSEKLSCLDCSSNQTFSRFDEIVNHNIEHHANLSRWSCFACGSKVNCLSYFQHFLSYTKEANVVRFFGDYTAKDFAKDIFILQNLRHTPIANGSVTENDNAFQQMPIKHWISHDPVVDNQGNITFIKNSNK